MINYFYKKYFKYKLNPINIKNCYFLETTPILCTNVISKDRRFLNTSFLLYSILNFYIWVRFIIEYKLSLLVIVEYMDMSILKSLFISNNLHVISEKAWIPGILSNSNEIWYGNRYLSLVAKNVIQLTTYPDFLFLCSTKRPLISQETNNQLIPQFAVILTMTNVLSSYFIPLFTPKLKIKKRNKIFAKRTGKGVLNCTNINSCLKKKREVVEKYLITTNLLKIKEYLIYFLFFNAIEKSL